MGSPFFIISVLGLFDIFKLCACITLVKVKIQKKIIRKAQKKKKSHCELYGSSDSSVSNMIVRHQSRFPMEMSNGRKM